MRIFIANKFIFILLLFLKTQTIYSQTFTSGAVNTEIPENIKGVVIPINISGMATQLDSTFGIESVCVNIIHPISGEIDFYLISPDGTTIELNTDNGDKFSNFLGTCFSMTADTFIVDTVLPYGYSGNFRPEGDLGAFNNYQNPNGDWKLYVCDDQSDSIKGNLVDWSISFGEKPAHRFISSNLPIMILNTNEQYITDEPKIMADMGIIDNGQGQINNIKDAWNNYNGKIGIENRGSSSQQFPKKPYGFETWDSTKNQIDVSLLNLPANHNWTLYASYSDKSLIRNFLAYKLFEKMGHYSVRSKYIELVLNKSYQGVYMLIEKIGRGINNINISKLSKSDTSYNTISGGYIFKLDKKKEFPYIGWESKFASNTNDDKTLFQYYYPKPENILPIQKNYIQSYVDSFEIALNSENFSDDILGYNKYINLNSFIDNFIINEVSKNVDSYRLSTYFFKDKDSLNDKLNMGPIWDFDLGFNNANFGGGNEVAGWQYTYGWNWTPSIDTTYPTPFWWRRFMEDPNFVNQLNCRYHQLRSTILNIDTLFTFIDSTANVLSEAQNRNFNYWPTLGKYVWPNTDPIAMTYEEEITKLKNWLSDRLIWIDANIPGTCILTDVKNVALHTNHFETFPNPINDKLQVKYQLKEHNIVRLSIFNLTGQPIKEIINRKQDAGIYIEQISMEDLASGIYFVKFSYGNEFLTKKIMKINN